MEIQELVFIIYKKVKVINMMQRKIMLRPSDVNAFVNAATKCSFDIDVSYNRFVVDAKSIVGVLGLDLTKTLTVTCNGYDSEFEQFLNHLAVAC